MARDIVDLETTKTVMMNPGTMAEICDHMANGGSMIDKCKAWNVPYGRIMTWINSDPERADQYSKSLIAQMYWAIDRVLKELNHIGTVDLSDAYNDRGALKRIQDIPEDIRRCIAGVETDEIWDGVGKDRTWIGYTKKIKLFDKIKALELIGKKFAMFVDRTRVDIHDKTLEDLVNESMAPEVIDVDALPTPPPLLMQQTDQNQNRPPPPGDSSGASV